MERLRLAGNLEFAHFFFSSSAQTAGAYGAENTEENKLNDDSEYEIQDATGSLFSGSIHQAGTV